MPVEEYLVPPAKAPDLHIPASTSTVSVGIIDCSARIKIGTGLIVQPPIKGHDTIHCPCYSFLVSHPTQKRHLLFDLGLRKDWTNLPPSICNRIKENGWGVVADHNVVDILDATAATTGVSSKDIEAVIWSHHHWDHTGDMTTFGASTELILGPGLRAAYPTYPSDESGTILDSDFAGRPVREIDFSTGLTIGSFRALDFFGDGSFYLLDTPGHTVGHMCALARTRSEPAAFVFMGGDACHHVGEFRPTAWRPLPTNITPSPLRAGRACPGSLLLKVHPEGCADKPFYVPAPGFNVDGKVAEETIVGVTEFDADDGVFVVVAHDATLLGQVKMWPEPVDAWREQDVAEKVRWKFVGDFEDAVEGG